MHSKYGWQGKIVCDNCRISGVIRAGSGTGISARTLYEIDPTNTVNIQQFTLNVNVD